LHLSHTHFLIPLNSHPFLNSLPSVLHLYDTTFRRESIDSGNDLYPLLIKSTFNRIVRAYDEHRRQLKFCFIKNITVIFESHLFQAERPRNILKHLGISPHAKSIRLCSQYLKRTSFISSILTLFEFLTSLAHTVHLRRCVNPPTAFGC